MPKSSKLPVKLNLGCGLNKIKGYINIDCEKSVKPDMLVDFGTAKLPFKENSVDEIIMFHTIEHIRKPYHKHIFAEARRVLRVDGRFILSYPEFTKCVENWKTNYLGKKEFWEATIYGAQRFPSDHHVCIIEPKALQRELTKAGFEGIKHTPEPEEHWNTITVAYKSERRHATYDEVVRGLKYKLVS